MNLGELIKVYREENKLTSQELADKCLLSKGYISMLENNFKPSNTGKEITPSIMAIKKLANGMNFDFDYILSLIDGTVLLKEELTEIPMDNFVCDDYFPLRYCTNLSAGSFDELLDSEPNAIVYVPISFQNKMKRLIAFKVNGTSMDNIIEDGSIVVVEQTDIKHKDGTVVVAYCDGLTTVKRIYTKEDCLVLMPDSKDKSHMPIMITEEKQVYIIGKVIWHMNGEDISKYY